MATNGKSRQSNPKRGSGSRLNQIRSGTGDEEGSQADWGTVEPKVVMALISAVALRGGATRFGYTRDGGAYSLGIYMDDDRETWYFRPYENLAQVLGDLVERIEEIPAS